MTLVIEPFDSGRHDPETVARLIYEADPALTSLVMGSGEKAMPRFRILMGIETSPWASKRITVATHQGEVVGVIVGATGKEKTEADRRAAEWGKALGIGWILGSICIGMKIAKTVTRDVADDEYYPLAIAVSDHVRGQGVGSQLMKWILDRHAKVVIDVNIEKADARRFYERHGFESVGENTVKHKGKRIGNLSMRNIRRADGRD